MADKLEFDSTPAPPTSDGERKLEFDTPSREKEIRTERLKALVAAGEPGYTARLKDAWTSGLSRPIGGALSVATGEIGELFGGKPATVGERWRGGVGAEEDYAQRAKANTPGVLGHGVDLLGGLASGGRSVGTAVPGIGVQALRAGTQGAVEGAAKNAEDVGSAATGAALGGGISAGTAGVLGALTNRLGRVAGAKKDLAEAGRGGSSQSLQHEGSAIYQRLDNAGIHYSPRETAPLAGSVAQRLADAGFNPTMHRELIPALNEIGGASGQRTTWTQLQNMRTQISDLKASPDPRLRRVAGELNNELDNFISTAKPTMPASSVAAGINPAQDVAEARGLWQRGSQAGRTEYLAEKGMLTTKDPGRQLETNFGKEIDKVTKPGRYNPNSPEQMELMRSIAEGSPRTSTAARGLDRWGNNLFAFGSAGAAGGLGASLYDPASAGGGVSAGGATAMAAGLLSKGGGASLRRMVAEQGSKKVDDLLRNIVTGQTQAAPGAYVPRDALALLLAKQDLARGAGNYAASAVNRE